jgi:hypothetical protein
MSLVIKIALGVVLGGLILSLVLTTCATTEEASHAEYQKMYRSGYEACISGEARNKPQGTLKAVYCAEQARIAAEILRQLR